jgi:hypothetical protein
MSASEIFGTVGKWLKRLVGFSFLIAFVAFLGWFMFIWYANYSDGSRTGYITKLSHKGVIFKTWEGEMNFGFFGLGQNTKASENIWHFSVLNDDVAQQIQLASETGQKVTVFYKQKYQKIFFRGDTEYFVYRVDVMKE